ncbi:MAG: thiamine-monophosphate kinase [Ignavibacteriales bacterium]|nr:thiamine-monophosphate kinase [Ignavibacteriales bacterium]
MMLDILENQILSRRTELYRRSPFQLNSHQHADAELLNIGGVQLAVTADTLVEEIHSGLYADPFLIGWMTVMVSMSDLAAVGAEPLGILISETLPHHLEEDQVAKVHQGIEMACEACATYVLGGDTNSGLEWSMTGAAIGIVRGQRKLQRIGARAGDILYVTGSLGRGNAFAAEQLLVGHDKVASAMSFRATAKLREGRLFALFASSCMDTSDGLFATLDQLMRLNEIGFLFDQNWTALLDRESCDAARQLAIEDWMLLAGWHGEYELVFTIPASEETDFLHAVEESHVSVFRLGRVIKEAKIVLPLYGANQEFPTGNVRNLAHLFANDVPGFVRALFDIDSKLRKGGFHHAS